MSIVENLNRIKSCKESIKQAIINKGVDMTGVAFEGYADKINEISGGTSDDTEYIEFNKIATYATAWETPNCIFFKATTPNLEYGIDPNTGNHTWSGEGHLLTIAIYSENGSLTTGTYTANAGNNQVSAGQFNIGTDVDMGGWTTHTGTYFEILPDSWGTPTDITDGTIDVKVEGDKLVIKLKSSVINARFTGLLTDCPFEVIVYDPTDYLTVRKNITSYSSYELNIPNGAFYGMTNITEVSLPNAYDIPENAFNGCANLVSVNIPKASGVGIDAFGNCGELTAIDLPNATYVNPRSFENCHKLSYVNIPECENVSENAFVNCYVLPSIDIPKCVYIGSNAFSGCGALTSITATSCGEIFDMALGGTQLTAIDLPNCGRIGAMAFAWCNNLTSVYAPNCAEIAGAAFQGCGALTELDLSNVYYCNIYDTSTFDMTPFVNGEGTIKVHSSSLAYYQSTYPWSELAGCLVGAGDPDVVLLANDNGRIYGETTGLYDNYLGFLAIGNDAVISIDLPNASKAPYIQYYPNLQSINLGKLTMVNQMMFMDNYALTTVNLPECTYVDMNGFMNCYALTTVNLPKCTALGDNVFSNCTNLKTLTIGTEYTGGIVSNWNCYLPDSIEAIFVNPTFVDMYKSDWFWGQYADKIFAAE